MRTVNTMNVELARRNLTQFMIFQADRMRRVIGIGYKDVADAPSTYETLVAAYEHAKRTRTALPVWNGGCENTIYTSREGNLAFRYVHDCLHVQKQFKFTLEDEIANAHFLGGFVEAEFGKDSLEYRMYMADTAGQSVYAETHNGQFPENQLRFVYSILDFY